MGPQETEKCFEMVCKNLDEINSIVSKHQEVLKLHLEMLKANREEIETFRSSNIVLFVLLGVVICWRFVW